MFKYKAIGFMLRKYGESRHLMLATLPVEGVYEDCRQIEIKMEKFAQFFVEVMCPPMMMSIELLFTLSFINLLPLFNEVRMSLSITRVMAPLRCLYFKLILDFQIYRRL